MIIQLKKFLRELSQKPYHYRIKILWTTVSVLSVLIFVSWLSFFVYDFRHSNQENEALKGEAQGSLPPLDSLRLDLNDVQSQYQQSLNQISPPDNPLPSVEQPGPSQELSEDTPVANPNEIFPEAGSSTATPPTDSTENNLFPPRLPLDY